MDLPGLGDTIAYNGFIREWVPIDHHNLVERVRKDTRGAQAGYARANHNRVPTSIGNLFGIVPWNGC
jgi:hypothetical protein